MGQRIVIIGPAHPLRGGLAAFNERLAKAFMDAGDQVDIFTFSLQYPGFLFPGKTQYSDAAAPEGLNIEVCINSINPFNWRKTGRKIARLNPDLVIVAYWLPFMGPCLGRILRSVKKKSPQSRIISLTHNIIPHEKRPGDKAFTRYFVKPVDAFIVLSRSVADDIQQFVQNRPIEFIPHPIYDSYGPIIPRETARQQLKLDPSGHYLLFFGFIRAYKGLDLLLEAMADPRIREAGIKAIIAGEFYSDRKPYDEQIAALGIEDLLVLHTDFIPDDQVGVFFGASDLVVQPYKTATQSGISQLAYHFEVPMLVTKVGGLPEIVADGKAGYVCELDPKTIADAIIDYYENQRQSDFQDFIREEKKRFSWENMVNGMKKIASL